MAKQKVGSGVIHGGDHCGDHGGDHGGVRGGDQRGRGERVENFVHHLALALRNHLKDLSAKITHEKNGHYSHLASHNHGT